MDVEVARALASLTTGIYVLTARWEGKQHGMSSSWSTQVSGHPALVMVAVDRGHLTHQMIERSGAFALNVVGAASRHLEDYFYSAASRKPDNLEPFALEFGVTGTPLLRDALASLECRVVSSYEAGDHTLFVGKVVGARVRRKDKPLTSRDLPYVYLGGEILFDPEKSSFRA